MDLLCSPASPGPGDIHGWPGTYLVCESTLCCQKETSYPVASFSIRPEDITTDVSKCHHRAQCEQCQEHACGSGAIRMMFPIRKCNTRFKKTCLGCLFGCLPGKVVYNLTVSENGIVRFHISPERSTLTRLLFAYGDSESCCWCCGGSACGCYKNVLHALENGCFCLGLFFIEKLASEQKPRLVLMRYNRWAGDICPYWAGIHQGN